MTGFQVLSKIGHIAAVAAIAVHFYLFSPGTDESGLAKYGWQLVCAFSGYFWFSLTELIPIIEFLITKDNIRLHPSPDKEWEVLKRQTMVDITRWNALGIVLFALIITVFSI